MNPPVSIEGQGATAWLAWLFLVVLTGVVAWLTAYATKSGELKATKDALDNTLRELERTTEVAESVRLQLSMQNWIDQRWWDSARDAFVSTIGHLQVIVHSVKVRQEDLIHWHTDDVQDLVQGQRFKQLQFEQDESLRALERSLGQLALFGNEALEAVIQKMLDEIWFIKEAESSYRQGIHRIGEAAEAARSEVLSLARSTLQEGGQRATGASGPPK